MLRGKPRRLRIPERPVENHRKRRNTVDQNRLFGAGAGACGATIKLGTSSRCGRRRNRPVHHHDDGRWPAVTRQKPCKSEARPPPVRFAGLFGEEGSCRRCCNAARMPTETMPQTIICRGSRQTWGRLLPPDRCFDFRPAWRFSDHGRPDYAPSVQAVHAPTPLDEEYAVARDQSEWSRRLAGQLPYLYLHDLAACE
ncbi:hypothetical protein PDO_5109 [Rhizobium sp. PDO1-076]|nr:hypothetical protein PDO_5109 [Rhizobium sp. PDO1-076]